MASFMNEASQSSFDAQSYANGVTTSREKTRSGSGLSNGFFGIGGNVASSSYDVVGIDTKQIPDMQKAINTYVNEVQEHLSQVKVTTEPSVALKGTEMEIAVKEYVAKVVEYCNALCSNLLAFSDKLYKVQQAWENSDANMSKTINGGAGELNSASQTYTEQYRQF